jgi:hypothetical protein
VIAPAWWPRAATLAEPWPTEPAVSPEMHGWTVWRDHLARLLELALERHREGGASPVVLEVGAWLGKTSVYLLETYPDLFLVCIDIWEHHGIIHERARTAFETWQANVWPYRDRVLAVRKRSEIGMIELARLGARPDLVYVDAAHDYGQAYLDTAVACACFPDAAICGDDFTLNVRGEELNVGHAVTRFAQRAGWKVGVHGRFWELSR